MAEEHQARHTSLDSKVNKSHSPSAGSEFQPVKPPNLSRPQNIKVPPRPPQPPKG